MVAIPRHSRIDALGALHHAIIRGIERKAIFKDLGALDRYLVTGHSVIMGNQPAAWQDDDRILGMSAKTRKAARRKYRQFVEKGIDAGRRPELVGGGLIRCIGGWKMAKTRLKGQDRVKGDERILGDGEFVQSVLDRCHEDYSRRQRRVAQGVDLKMFWGIRRIFQSAGGSNN